MKNAVLTFAVLGCFLVVAANAIFGFRTSDNMLDGSVAAAIFAFVSFAGLAGHAVAVRLWSINRGWAIGIGVITVGAMVVSLTNSLGFVVLRGEASRTAAIAEMSAISDARAELERLLERRASLPGYTPATEAQVSAARDAAAAATLAREAECEKRGPNCRSREVDEIAANTTVVAIEGNRAATQVAEELDAKIVDARAKLSSRGGNTDANPLGAALAALATFVSLPGTDATTAVTVQQALLAIMLELLIVGAFIANELLSRSAPAAATAHTAPGLAVAPRSISPEQLQAEVETAARAPPNLVRMPNREQLKLVVNYAAQRLEVGRSAPVDDLYADFNRWAGGDNTLDKPTFVACLNPMCDRMGWRLAQGRIRGVSLKTGT